MQNIHLEGKVLEAHKGRNIDTAPALLERWEKGEGYIPSEGDVRRMGVSKYAAHPEVMRSYWDTSTLLATKGDEVKVILPYDNSGSHELTEAAQFGLGLIHANEKLVHYGVDLDKDDRWEQLDGSGVYTLQRKELILNEHLKKKDALEHPLLLTKLGHPDYVASNFARPKEEVEEIIEKTFEIGGREHGYDTMMGQFVPDERKQGVMKASYVCWLEYGSRSDAGAILDFGSGRFAFVSVGDAAFSE